LIAHVIIQVLFAGRLRRQTKQGRYEHAASQEPSCHRCAWRHHCKAKAYVMAEYEKWGNIIRRANVKLD
jgi:hypothetical protein